MREGEGRCSYFMIAIMLYSYTEVEKDTITMVLYHLLASSHLADDVKSRIRVAAGLGRSDHCHIFSCELNLGEPSLF